MKPTATVARVGLAFAFCCLCSSAAAQPSQPPAEPSTQPTSTVPVQPKPVPKPVPVPVKKNVDPADAKALALYKQGDADYAAGKYTSAAARFKRAYELSGRPVLLFNMANAYQQLRQYAKAAESLNNYVSHAEPKERAAIRSRIVVLRQLADSKRKELANVQTMRLQIRGYQAERSSGREWAYAAWAVGTLSLVSGVVFAERASHAAEDALRDCVSGAAGPVCLRAAESRFDDEKRNALIADISFTTGLIAVAAGVYLWLRATGKERRAKTAIQPRFGTRAAGMDFGLQF